MPHKDALPMKKKKLLFSLLLAVALVAGSYYFLDAKIALFVKKASMSHTRLAILSANIPDFLWPLVCFLTGAAWMIYFFLLYKGIYNTHTRFFLLVAITIPATFLLESYLKHVVGRINTRFWLHHVTFKEFRWFHGGGNYSSFPSGHMAVFAALLYALWKFYPRQRAGYVAFLAGLATALIVTNYHFLSDVIAGLYVGGLIPLVTDHGLTYLRKSRVKFQHLRPDE